MRTRCDAADCRGRCALRNHRRSHLGGNLHHIEPVFIQMTAQARNNGIAVGISDKTQLTMRPRSRWHSIHRTIGITNLERQEYKPVEQIRLAPTLIDLRRILPTIDRMTEFGRGAGSQSLTWMRPVSDTIDVVGKQTAPVPRMMSTSRKSQTRSKFFTPRAKKIVGISGETRGPSEAIIRPFAYSPPRVRGGRVERVNHSLHPSRP